MSVVWVTRSFECVFVLLAVLASVITYHPKIQLIGNIITGMLGGLGVLGLGLSVMFGRWPSNHWAHRPRPIGVVILLAGVIMVVLAVIGG